MYEQLQLPTHNQFVGSIWRGQRVMKEEEGEEWRAMKAGDVSDGER